MENRFGFKELVICVLMIVVVVVVLLAMKQYDRQYDRINQLLEQQRSQTNEQSTMRREITEIKGMLERGVIVGTIPATQSSGSTTRVADGAPVTKDAFTRMREAKKIPAYAEGDWCVDVFGAKVAKITPLTSGDVYGSAIQGHVQEGLASRDPDTFEWLPLLATSWTTKDNTDEWQRYVDERQKVPVTEKEIVEEADYKELVEKKAEKEKLDEYVKSRKEEGRRIDDITHEGKCPPATVYTFKLRNDVTFSDGTPMTSDDFIFTWALINNPKVDCPRDRQFLDKISSVTAKGPYEIEFRIREPHFESFVLAAGLAPMPKHFYSKYSPEEFNAKPGLLMGTGPYRMPSAAGWAPGDPLILLRNERYWGVRPGFDRIIYREVNEDPVRLTMFRNREVDYFSALPEQYVELRKDAALMARVKRFEFDRITSGYRFIAWNQMRKDKPTVFADKRVRQAMTMLIDRKRIIDELMLGFGVQATGPFNPLSPQCDPDIKPWPYDPKRALALLKEAGFERRSADGPLVDRAGTPMRFKITIPAKGTFWERFGLLVKDSMATVGIAAEIDALEWSVYDERIKSRDFDTICMGWSGGIESDVRQMFHSSQIADQADNFTSYRNPKLDALIDRARRSVDEKQRMPLWREVHRILNEDQPYTFLAVSRSLTFVDGRIENIQQVKSGLNERDEWFVPKASQFRKD